MELQIRTHADLSNILSDVLLNFPSTYQFIL